MRGNLLVTTIAVQGASSVEFTRHLMREILGSPEMAGQMGKDNAIVLGPRPREHIDSAWTLPGWDDVPDKFAVLSFEGGAQLSAPGTSLSRGNGTDSPSPSGQVNRLVKGVSVHTDGGR